jgi:hypothetical protein
VWGVKKEKRKRQKAKREKRKEFAEISSDVSASCVVYRSWLYPEK